MDPLLSVGEFAALTGRGQPDPLVTLAASGIVRAYCGWEISEVVDQAVTLDVADGGSQVMLPTLRLTNVSAVVVNGVGAYGLPPVQPASWTWSTAGIVCLAWLSWNTLYDQSQSPRYPSGLGRLTVTYSGGYPAGSVPDEIKAVTCSVAERVTAPSDIAQRLENVGGIQTNTTYARASDGNGLSATEVAVLARYRIPEFR